MSTNRFCFKCLVLVLLTLTMVGTASATEVAATPGTPYDFTLSDFVVEGTQGLQGVFLTAVPTSDVATLSLGNRQLLPGDVVSVESLANLTLTAGADSHQEAELCYLPIYSSGIGTDQAVVMTLGTKENQPPVAKDSVFETYKNVANDGKLDVVDVEEDALTFQITKEPKRGAVEIQVDGTFTYTPNNNKVGEDSFTYTATDESGNVSNEATVSVDIGKPIDKLTYGDMIGDTDEFEALWLRNQRLFVGESIGGTVCFNPDKSVTRGEFVVMMSKLTGINPDDVQLTSGFADEDDTPVWMQPYVVSALRAGIINGVTTEAGLEFQPSANLTGAEAAVMLQNTLHLPIGELEVSDFENSIPVWAESAVESLAVCGFPMDIANCTEDLTRRDAARLLYAASGYVTEETSLWEAIFK